MTNETKIKVPKKYHRIVESIKKVSDYHRYRVTLREGYLAENPWMISSLTRFFFARSQKEVLAFIRSARAVEIVPAPAPEEPATKEELTNVETNDTANPVEQDHVPFAVAADEASARSDQEATAPVVDDKRVLDRNQYYCRFRFPDTLKVCPVLYGCIPECQPP